jgi:hypothetical protein
MKIYVRVYQDSDDPYTLITEARRKSVKAIDAR